MSGGDKDHFKILEESLAKQDSWAGGIRNPGVNGSRKFTPPVLSITKFLDRDLGEVRAEQFSLLMDCTGEFKNLRGGGRVMSNGRVMVRRPFQPGFLFQLPKPRVPWFTHQFCSPGSMFGPPGSFRRATVLSEFGESAVPRQYQVSKILDMYLLLRLLNGRTQVFQREVEECLNFIHQDQGGVAKAYGPARLEAYLAMGDWAADPALSFLIFKPCDWKHQNGVTALYFSRRRPASKAVPDPPQVDEPPAPPDSLRVTPEGEFYDPIVTGIELTDEEIMRRLTDEGFFPAPPDPHGSMPGSDSFADRFRRAGLGPKEEK